MFSPSDAARHTFGRSGATVAEVIDRRREESEASEPALTTNIIERGHFLHHQTAHVYFCEYTRTPPWYVLFNVLERVQTGTPNVLRAVPVNGPGSNPGMDLFFIWRFYHSC